MDALLTRITASLNEQQNILEAAVNARTAALNGNRQAVTATATTAAVEGEGANGTITQGADNNALQLEVTQMGNRLKILIPVLILIILKVLADNFILGAVTIVSLSSFYRLKAAFELELALKERSNKIALGGLCLLSTGLLLTILYKIELFGYDGHVVDRLLFRVPDSSFHATMLQTIWICAVTDGIMLLSLLTLKMYAVSLIGLSSQVRIAGFKSLLCIPAGWTGRDGIFGNRAHQGAHGADVESGGFASSSQPAAAVSALFGSISGLVRRQVNSLHTAHTAYSSVSGTEQSIPTATPVDSDGVNSSDGSTTGQESKDFLLKVRICSLIDVAGLVYRSALPVILWGEYFSRCVAIGPALQILYVGVKLYDLMAKGKGAVQAAHMLATSTLEFGHYSTTEELRGREDGACDCPVCFDNPHTPVTLDCQHIFCEVCILEWLEKEQTCPVCRAQVSCCDPVLQAVKTDAASTVPIAV